MQYIVFCDDPDLIMAAFSSEDYEKKMSMVSCLYKKYAAGIMSSVLHQYGKYNDAGDKEDVKDAWHAAMLNIISRLNGQTLKHTASEPLNIRGYFYYACRNEYLKIKRAKVGSMAMPCQFADEQLSGLIEKERQNEKERKMELLQWCMKEMSDKCRDMLEGKYYRSEQVKDIAERRKVSVDYLYVEFTKCRGRLKECLGPGFILSDNS